MLTGDETLWTGAEATAATGGGTGPGADWQASGVSIDSRTCRPGDLFVALVGDRSDGHAWVSDALSKGAAAAVVHRDVRGASGPLLRVDDTFHALRGLGRAGRDRMAGRVVALTGSVGKTGTKEMLRAALAAIGSTWASEGNLNNHWGAPLSLARMPRTSRFGVFELGMNHAGEIEPLARLARPHVALITRIAPVHVEFFDSVAGIADAKAEIFAGLEPGGIAVLPRDDEWYARLADRAREAGAGSVITFGAHGDSDVRLLSCDAGEEGTRVEADVAGRRVSWHLGVDGRHWVTNSLGVAAVVHALGVDVDAGMTALAAVEAPKGRGRRRRIRLARGGTCTLIDESYNASPPAVRAALDVLATVEPGRGGRRIALLGDMLELGRDGPAMHRDLAPAITSAGVARVDTVGSLMGELRDALPGPLRGHHDLDAATVGRLTAADVRDGDVILVKGSLGVGMRAALEELEALEASPPVGGAATG